MSKRKLNRVISFFFRVKIRKRLALVDKNISSKIVPKITELGL